MAELLQLQHMEQVPIADRISTDSYYMPHRAVMKQDSSGKIRVVFNASQATKSSRSLNDCLHTGPKLQADICHAGGASTLSFRQFRMHEDDVNWLRILWRNNPSEKILPHDVVFPDINILSFLLTCK